MADEGAIGRIEDDTRRGRLNGCGRPVTGMAVGFGSPAKGVEKIVMPSLALL